MKVMLFLCISAITILAFQNCSEGGFSPVTGEQALSNINYSEEDQDSIGEDADEATSAPLTGVAYGNGLIVTNQFGRVYVTDFTFGANFDYSSNARYDVISYKIDYNKFVQMGGSGYVQFSSVRYSGASQARLQTISSVPGDLNVSDACKNRLEEDASVRARYSPSAVDNTSYVKSINCVLNPSRVYYLNIATPNRCTANSDVCRYNLSVTYSR